MADARPLLPEVRIRRPDRGYLKDKEFLHEIGLFLAFLGIFLSLCVLVQRYKDEGPPPDAFMMIAIFIMLCLTFGMSVSGLIMAGIRLMTANERPRSFLLFLAISLTMCAVGYALMYVIIVGITRLILPMQMFFAWVAMFSGFSLLELMRQRRSNAKDSNPT